MESEQNHVPEGWISARIDEIVEVNPGKPPKDLLPSDAPVSFVPMPAVDAEKGAITEPEVREYHKVRSGYTAFRNDDLIVAKITPCMENGKAAVARDLVNGLGFGSSEFHVLRSRGTVLPEYLYHFVRQQSFRDNAAKQMTGSVGQKRVPADFIKSSVIPLPPLPEQRQIVAQLEALLADVERVRGRLEGAAATMQRFRQAVLASAIDGHLTAQWRKDNPELESAASNLQRIAASRSTLKNKSKSRTAPTFTDSGFDKTLDFVDGWAWCQLQDIAIVCLGGTPSRKDERYWDGDIPWVSSGEVANCRISSTRERITSTGLANSSAKIYPKGTVLIAMIGEGKTRGQSAILDVEACTNQNVAGLVFDSQEVYPEFIWYWAQAKYTQTRRSGRGGEQPALNGLIVRDMMIHLPPLHEQHELVRRVEALFALADRIEGEVAGARERVEALTQAVLAKAFRGELVPTEAELARREGREYEPAGVLLERVRAERQDGRPKTR